MMADEPAAPSPENGGTPPRRDWTRPEPPQPEVSPQPESTDDPADAEDEAAYEELPLEEGPDEARGWHFARLAFHPVTLSYGTIVAIAVFSILTVVASPLAGAVGAAAVLVGTYVVVYVIAGRRAGEDFYGLYAEERALTRSLHGTIPPVTPLLRSGDRRAAEQVMTGELPGGLRGTLALYTYELDTYELDIEDGELEPDVDYFDYTLTLAELPETASSLRELSCERRFGLGGSSHGETPERSRRLTLGDERFDSGYEIFFDPRGDERRLRGLFSPEFTRWLADEAPPDLAFELVAGSVCVNVEDHMDTVEELDELCEASGYIAERLRDAARA